MSENVTIARYKQLKNDVRIELATSSLNFFPNDNDLSYVAGAILAAEHKREANKQGGSNDKNINDNLSSILPVSAKSGVAQVLNNQRDYDKYVNPLNDFTNRDKQVLIKELYQHKLNIGKNNKKSIFGL
jgi:hypothetical protein